LRPALAWLLGGLLSLLPTVTHAVEQAKLDDVITSALTNSMALKREVARIHGAEGQVQEAAGAFDWKPMAQTGWERLYVPLGVNGLLTTQTDALNAWRTTTSVGRAFRNGIEMAPGVTFTENSGGVSSGQSLGLTRTIPSLGLKIPLLQGLGEDVADADEKAAQTGLQATQLHHQFIMQQVVHDTVQVFWKCRSIIEQQKIAEQSAHNAADYAAWLRSMADSGQVEPVAGQKAETDQTSRQISLGRGADAIEACRRELLIVSGGTETTPPTPVGDLPSPDKIGPSIAQLDQEGLTKLALNSRLDLQALERIVEEKSGRVHAAQDGLLPKVDLFVDPTKVYLNYSQPIGNDVAHGRIAQAEAAQSQAQLDVEELRTRIRQDVAGTVDALRRAWQSWKMLSDTRAKIEASIAVREKQVKAGVVGRDQLLGSQDVLTEIRHEQVEARLQVASALATLRLAVGMIEIDGRAPTAIAGDFFALPRP
jgi:outer membrane protein TolC